MQLKIIIDYIEAVRCYDNLKVRLTEKYNPQNNPYLGVGLTTEDQEIYSNILYNYELCKKRLNRRVKQKLDK